MSKFDSLVVNGDQLEVASGNLLLIPGNGSQGFFKNDSYVLREHMEERFGTDAYLNDVAGRLDSRFAVVTLNISWPFPHQFAFHGTVAHNTIPEPSKVDEHIGEALNHLKEAFDSDSPVHVVFLGVGLTGANGFGLQSFLGGVQDEYGISRITVVDPKPMTARRTTWLQSAFEPPVEVEHVGQTVESWLASARSRDSMTDYTGPTFAQMSKMLTSKKCAEAMVTSDGRVVDFIAKLHRKNGLQAAARSKRKLKGRRPKKKRKKNRALQRLAAYNTPGPKLK